MKVLLTHGYFLNEDLREQQIMKPYPPLGLLYLAAFLDNRHIDNTVYDSTFSSFADQLKFIGHHRPAIVAIYANLMTKINVVKLVKLLRTNAHYGFPTIIIGGPDVTFNCREYLSAGAHFLVIGEGEETLSELSEAILQGLDVNTISGIAFLENGEVLKTPARTHMKSLAELPLPKRSAIDMSRYLETWKKHHGKSAMTISTQRGCPYTCKWCSTAVYGQSYRRRPAELVADEMLMLKTQYGPDSIWFVDDVFTVSHKWIGEFCCAVEAKGAKIPFECITRAERLNPEILQMLKLAGCFRIWIGAESGSQKIIDAMDRRVKVDEVASAIRMANALGIETGTFIMIGYPGEDEHDIRQTIDYLKEANPTHFTITVAYPIKGTSLYQEVESSIVHRPDWQTSTDRDLDFTRTYPRKYYDYAVSKVMSEVSLHREFQGPANPLRMFKYKSKSWLAGAMMEIWRRR